MAKELSLLITGVDVLSNPKLSKFGFMTQVIAISKTRFRRNVQNTSTNHRLAWTRNTFGDLFEMT